MAPQLPPKWARLSRERIFSCDYYDLVHDRYQQPNGEAGDYYFVDIAGSTMIVPREADGRLVLIRQYRYLVGRECVEFPTGGLPRGVDPLDNARRELREEAGLVAGRWHALGQFAPYKGVSNDLCRVFLAEELTRVPAAPEPTEEIEVLRLSAEELEHAIVAGEIWDGMTLAAFALLKHCR